MSEKIEKTESEKTELDKKAIAADDKIKTNLEDTEGAVLDDGKSKVPVKQDPFAARKAIFGKSKDVRATRIAQDVAQHADVQNITEALDKEMGEGTGNELDRGDHFDTNRTRVEVRQQPEQRVNDADADKTGTVAELPERVKVKVLGQEFEVPREDVEEAGGLKAYQLERAASIRLQNAAREEARLKAERDQFERDKRASAGASPAPAAGSTPAAAPTSQGGAGESADVAARAEAIVSDLYSGDPKRAKAAVQQVLAASQSPQIDPKELARQAAELLQQREPAPAPAATQPVAAQPIDPEVAELNEYMSSQFEDVLQDDTMRAKALSEFNRLKALPENRQRRLIDLGREAGREARKSGPHPRQDVVERKQKLPPSVAGTQTHAPAEQQPMSRSEHIAVMRKARGLPT